MASKRKGASGFVGRYLFDGMGYMALGLYVSLMLGVVFDILSGFSYLSFLKPVAEIFGADSALVGAACGVALSGGLGYGLCARTASVLTGAIGYSLGGPICAYLSILLGAEAGNLLSGHLGGAEFLLVPFVSVLAGGLAARFTGPYLSEFMGGLGALINGATKLHPVFMGMAVSVLVGLTAVAPLGSVSICLSLGLEGLAAGAACVGCTTQMIGFALCAYRENRLGGTLTLALGSAMPEFGNALRRPLILLPNLLASAVMGPLSTAVFQLKNTSLGAGMGSSGLVGQICAFRAMGGFSAVELLILLLLAHFVLPAILVLFFHMLFYRAGFIRNGDMRILSYY